MARKLTGPLWRQALTVSRGVKSRSRHDQLWKRPSNFLLLEGIRNGRQESRHHWAAPKEQMAKTTSSNPKVRKEALTSRLSPRDRRERDGEDAGSSGTCLSFELAGERALIRPSTCCRGGGAAGVCRTFPQTGKVRKRSLVDTPVKHNA